MLAKSRSSGQPGSPGPAGGGAGLLRGSDHLVTACHASQPIRGQGWGRLTNQRAGTLSQNIIIRTPRKPRTHVPTGVGSKSNQTGKLENACCYCDCEAWCLWSERLPILSQISSCGLTIKVSGPRLGKMNHFFPPIIGDWEKYMQPCWERQLSRRMIAARVIKGA